MSFLTQALADLLYAAIGHDHDGNYSPLGHNHDGSYSPLGHNHDGSYSPLGHNHDSSYSPLGHNHDGSYLASLSGLVMMFGGAAAPAGWLLCDGAAVSRSTYAGLFAAIGTTWGVGDGSTTFNVPDLRGRAPIGVGTGAGLTARALAAQVGAETHQLTINEMPAHTHQVDSRFSTVAGSVPASVSGSIQTNYNTNSRGGDAAHNNMQPSVAVNFIIKT